jgi:hypothetical protein
MDIKTIEVEGNTYAEIRDGKPVYVDDKGKETTYDPVAMHSTISRLNHEAQTQREAKELLEGQVATFKDIDPVAAKKAIETVKNLDDKKLIDAGEVERVKTETAKVYQQKLDDATTENEKLRTQYSTEKMNAAFASSAYIKDKLAVPSDMAQAAFGRHFVFKEGKLNPIDQNGNPIYSDSNPGDIATFDEALEKIVQQYPHRDSILKGSGHTGAGSTPPGEGAGKRTISRKQFESMNPTDQQKYARSPDVKITD